MGTLRLIAGEFGGRSIRTPSSDATHPMSERARAGVFNVLVSHGFQFEDANVLDLFAGSGALGLEAVGRGASQVTFVEKNRQAAEAIRGNIEQLGLDKERARVAERNVFSPASDMEFGLVFCDPPYGDYGKNVSRLAELLDGLRVGDGAVLVLSRPSDGPGMELADWRLWGSKKYAEAMVEFYSR
ncbi:RsmD family RNA methyltransferase [Candidatus Saccharibacteria bacterium]|nr:RsmD family RNA methyltransferase [Candidatus Saccharibacteria bacterium]